MLTVYVKLYSETQKMVNFVKS